VKKCCACVLSIEDETVHAQHFFSRTKGSLGDYLDSFGEIRRLQDFIVGRAEHEGVAVIENASAERATADVIELVLAAAQEVRAQL